MNLRYRRILFVLWLFLVFGTSCSTPLQEVTYLNGIKTGLTYTNGPLPVEYRIRSNDQLYIRVISDDPLNAAFLNLAISQTNSGATGSSLELITYLVDEKGKIAYPQLGEIQVAGLTTGNLRDFIQVGVDKYLEGASVFVRLVNRTVTVLGEVKSPGQKIMVKNQLTIFEALGGAGDVTDYGNRKNVKLIREMPEGKLVVQLDLTDPDLILSPYFYILPHDLIYVEPSTKVYGAKNLSYSAPLSITASVISIGLLILNLFK
ncbi:MAG: polysaccharide export protein [Prolixibacteraceae bacterium]|jgi:polysaccharide export outer membrane protein|nr:polysaccharide export protein [Prolixibacteraceae bacterium]MBT6766935.1 polysaccharide export protein [Prolixibacteraceae bacterium]MBT7000097.1 polysaccharide export protein [Prolixibacteraceae bacterium]MBT7395752.1 polysaccharide export protein [Prolixibacteraceae bacterium]